jgi:hypothetical protein
MDPPATECIRKLDVVNRGLSGYNTSQALKAFPGIFAAPAPGVAKLDSVVRVPHPTRSLLCLW